MSVTDRLIAQGVPDVRALLAKRATLTRQAAPLKAFAANLDAHRKAQRAQIGLVLQAETDDRYSAAALDAAASADPRYAEWLVEADLKLAQLAVLENKIWSITEMIRFAEAEVRYLTSELRITGGET